MTPGIASSCGMVVESERARSLAGRGGLPLRKIMLCLASNIGRQVKREWRLGCLGLQRRWEEKGRSGK